MLLKLFFILLFVYQVTPQSTTIRSSPLPTPNSTPTPPVNQTQANSPRVLCTTARIQTYIQTGANLLRQVLNCTDRMANLGTNFLSIMNDFYNYNFDQFRTNFQLRSQCNNGLCSYGDVEYFLTMLLRLRAQMNDITDLIRYDETMPASSKRCLNAIMDPYTDAASRAIRCPA